MRVLFREGQSAATAQAVLDGATGATRGTNSGPMMRVWLAAEVLSGDGESYVGSDQ